MASTRRLIDQKGRVWTHPAPGMAEALGYPDPDFDLWNYAIRNLGAIEVATDETGATVSMRSAGVGRDALRKAETLLEDMPPMPVRLRYEVGTWIEETYETVDEAAARLPGALWDAAQSTKRIAFLAQARRLDMLSEMRLNQIDTADERLALMFKKWRLSHGQFDSGAASFLVRFGLFDRTSVVSESSNDQALVIDHAAVGYQTYTNYDKTWIFSAQGKKVADQPDADYGRWIDSTYREVLDQGRPRFEYVDAVVQAGEAEPRRFRYNRLLLPWRNERGARIITGTSYSNSYEPAAAHA